MGWRHNRMEKERLQSQGLQDSQSKRFVGSDLFGSMEISRTGLGIMGIADTFIKMKIRYGSEESEKVSKKIFKALRDNAYIASTNIAKEKGAFPKFDKEKYLKGFHIK